MSISTGLHPNLDLWKANKKEEKRQDSYLSYVPVVNCELKVFLVLFIKYIWLSIS
jgi:hypothetical protein